MEIHPNSPSSPTLPWRGRGDQLIKLNRPLKLQTIKPDLNVEGETQLDAAG
jgi:hypothetical protein